MTVDFGWVDIAIAGFLLLSVLVGLARGFVFELLSLVGWFAAYFAALYVTPTLAPHVPVGETGSGLNYGVTFACVFLVALIAWGLGARLVRALIRATPLGFIDRLLGAFFGVVRGLVVLLVATTVIGVSPWSASAAWQSSRGAEWLQGLLQELRPLFDDQTFQPTSA